MHLHVRLVDPLCAVAMLLLQMFEEYGYTTVDQTGAQILIVNNRESLGGAMVALRGETRQHVKKEQYLERNVQGIMILGFAATWVKAQKEDEMLPH